MTREAGGIGHNEFIKGLQEQAIESAVSVTAGVHLPTDSESHVCPYHSRLIKVCKYSIMDKPFWSN